MIGAPNSGTSIAAKLYQVLGWNFEPDHEIQAKFIHLGWVARPSTTCATTDDPVEIAEAQRELRKGFVAARKPVIMKHHNLSWCLDKFTDTLVAIEKETTLILNRKDIRLVRRSTERRRGRHGGGWMGQSVRSWIKAAEKQFRLWPGEKHVLEHETVKAAVVRGDPVAFVRALGVEQYTLDSQLVTEAMGLYDPYRDAEGSPHHGKNGWRD